MGKEIERKFLVVGEQYKVGHQAHYIRQGYLCNEPGRIVRIRIEEEEGYFTIKGKPVGITWPEYEYAIPLKDAVELLDNLCPQPQIEKHRYQVEVQGFTWEVDEFLGNNEGLVVAEIELTAEDEEFSRPEWLGEEVTYDPKYLNVNLVRTPFTTWNKR